LAKIYAQKAFLENTASITWRIFLGVYYVAYIFMDSRSAEEALAPEGQSRGSEEILDLSHS
jgi:hypothetical protein